MMIQRRRSRGGLSSTGDDVNDDVDKIEKEGGGVMVRYQTRISTSKRMQRRHMGHNYCRFIPHILLKYPHLTSRFRGIVSAAASKEDISIYRYRFLCLSHW